MGRIIEPKLSRASLALATSDGHDGDEAEDVATMADTTVRFTRDEVRVAIAGELDIADYVPLDEELRRLEAQRPETLVIDIRDLTFLDSSGIRLMVEANLRAREDGRRLQVEVATAPQVERVIELVRLADVVELVHRPKHPDLRPVG